MTPSTPDLAARILAAIDETERMAAQADRRTQFPVDSAAQGGLPQLMSRNDFGMVFRRCAADRKRLELHHIDGPEQDRLRGFCAHCGWRFPCPDVRNLAAVYDLTGEVPRA